MTLADLPPDARVHGRTAGKALCEALGIDVAHVRSITIHASVDTAAWVEVEAYATANGLRTAERYLQRFELVPKEDDGGAR